MTSDRIKRDFPTLAAAMPSESDLRWLEACISPRVLGRAEDREAADPGAGLDWLRDCWWLWQDAGERAEGPPH
jgi:hypothetical protein